MSVLDKKLHLRNRNLDYLQLHWLEKTTGISAAKWDIYVIKELIDNALDADESAGVEQIEIKVELRYARDEKRNTFALYIDVANQTPFPYEYIDSIFDLDYYASSKSGFNLPTRGKQGNALKTIAGVPYALRHFFYGDYEVAHWPIIIENNQNRYTVAYQIDEQTDKIRLKTEKTKHVFAKDNYNWIRVGIDRFIQSSPRELKEFYEISRAIALFNPHVKFDWTVSIGDSNESWCFGGGKAWMGSFRGIAPVSWYDVGQFRSLLMQYIRKQSSQLTIYDLIASFPGFDKMHIEQVCRNVSAKTVQAVIKSSTLVQSLYDEIINVDLSLPDRITTAHLGGLGKTSMLENIAEFFGKPQQTAYRQVHSQDPQRPSCPFVLEVCGARFEDGVNRFFWTGINNTFNYGDPFLKTVLLSGGSSTNTGVRGLREFFESYGINKTMPYVIVIHLICPNIRYQDFSKTFIDATPFRDQLEQALGEVLEELTQGEQEAEKQREAVKREALKSLIPAAVDELSSGDHYFYSFEQLIRVVRRLYQEKEAVNNVRIEPPSSLETREAIGEYGEQCPDRLTKLIRRGESQIFLPGNDEISKVAISSITPGVLARYCVNKVVLFNDLVMANVFVVNGLLRRFDTAVLNVDGSSRVLVRETLDIVARWKIPLLLAHDATISGCAWRNELQQYLAKRNINVLIYDLGLTPAQGRDLELAADKARLNESDKSKSISYLDAWEQLFLFEDEKIYKLVSLTPELLKQWFHRRLTDLGFSEKMLPPDGTTKVAVQTVLRQFIQKWVMEQLDAKLRTDVIIDSVVRSVYDECKIDALIEQVQFDSEQMKQQSWQQLLEQIVFDETIDILNSQTQALRSLIYSKAGLGR